VSEQRLGLLREAELQARCAHAGIVRIVEAGELAGWGAFIAREYVEGCTLAERARGGIDWPWLDRVARVLFDALAHVHEQRDAEGRRVGLVHRDVTPANVLLGRDGSVKLTDFGLAHAPAWHGPLADDELAQGTRRYLPPEVLRGEAPDERSDLFQLALCLAELAGPSTAGLPSAGAPRAVVTLLERALESDPGQRYASAREMAVAWQRATDPTRA
jgi:serine/threonine-protein kinase